MRSIGGQPIIVYTAEIRRKLKIKLALVAKKLIKRGYKLLIYSVWGADHEYVNVDSRSTFNTLGILFKVFDLCYSLGLEKYVVSTDSPKFTTDIMDRVYNIEQNSKKIQEQYKKSQENYSPFN